MTIINPNSISGISSITALNSTAAINLFKADGTAANIIAGVTTGTNFKTGSSNLHNVGIEIAGINVLGADTPIGAGATIYNSGAALFTGTVTAPSLDISGDIDVDGHTNLDNVSVAGVTTFSEDTKFIGAISGRDLQWDKSDNALEFLDYTSAFFGTDNNLQIYHNAGNNNTYISENGTGSLLIQASDLYLNNSAGQNYIICATGGRVQLNFNGNNKLQTTNTGIDVTGVVNSTVAGGENRLKIETTSSGNPVLNLAAAGSGGHDIFYNRSTNELTFKSQGGSDRLKIAANGDLLPGTDSQYNIGSNAVRFANIYADTLYGDGSNLTGITQTTINSNADNRIITGSGTANTLNAEGNFLHDPTTCDTTIQHFEALKVVDLIIKIQIIMETLLVQE